MDMNNRKEYDLYHDIKGRTNGEIYLGVVGPVRTGKSTFIKKFMENMVLPNMEDENEKIRARDEMPQSSGGKTITTTEPKFVPKKAVHITLGDSVNVSVCLVDCVGYMVDGATGHMEEDAERMVKTPWFEEEIPFTMAAEYGTQKVIRDHATIGVVVTTDGSFGEIKREKYVPAEKETIMELKQLGKPFVVILNSEKPYSEETRQLAQEMENTYQVKVLPVNVEQMKKNDICQIMENALYEFPIASIAFYMPKWVDALAAEHPLKQDLIILAGQYMEQMNTIRDVMEKTISVEDLALKKCSMDTIDFSDGSVSYNVDMDDTYYYEMLSGMTGEKITGEYQLIDMISKMSRMKQEYDKILNALQAVRQKGYGVVTPNRTEIKLDKPELIKHGNKYGVKMKAESPSIHFIKANIETEIAPIVGSKEQAEDLIKYIDDARGSQEGIWQTNIFGKTIEQLVYDGINSKVSMIGDESQMKLQDTMQKIVNDSTGGMVCIII